MAFAAPLAIPAAEALWAGLAAGAVAVGGYLGIRAAQHASERDFEEAPAATTRSCPGGDCDPECPRITAAVVKTTNELKKRYAEMREDRFGLWPIRPQRLPGIGSWPGHVQQYLAKQVNLRNNLHEAAARRCSVPPDSWRWASTPPPRQPAP